MLFITVPAWIFSTLSFVVFAVVIYREDFGEQIAKKVALLSLNGGLFVFGLYFCIGFYQLLVVERASKFIVWRMDMNGSDCVVRGFFRKIDSFQCSEIVDIRDYVHKKNIRNLMTMLAWRCPNYLVELRDGREFYLSKDMDKAGDLLVALRNSLPNDGGS